MNAWINSLRKSVSERKWFLAFGVALVNDALDLAGIGSIPIIGDVLDLASSMILWRFLGKNYSVPTVLEFVPGLDFLPTYTSIVVLAYYREEYSD